MILDSATRKLQIVLTAAKTTLDMPVIVDYVDVTATALPVAGLTPSNTNGVTLVDILAAPAASTQRKVNGITIYNKDTAAKTLQIILNDNGTSYIVVDCTLQVDDTLGYTDTGGWYTQDLNGCRKTVLSLYTSPNISISITTQSTSFDLLNTTATTINFGGAATALTIGATTGTATIRNPTVNLGGTSALPALKVVAGGGNTNCVTITGSATNPTIGVSGGSLALAPFVLTSAPTAGQIGERIASSIAAYANMPATATYGDLASISLTAGTWDVSLMFSYFNNSATAVIFAAGIGTASGTSNAGISFGENAAYGIPGTGGTETSVAVVAYRLTVATTTTYYFKQYASYSAGTPQSRGRISAVRIA